MCEGSLAVVSEDLWDLAGVERRGLRGKGFHGEGVVRNMRVGSLIIGCVGEYIGVLREGF